MNEDKIIQKLVEIDSKVDRLASQERVDQLEGIVLDQFDNQGVILERLDQERLFTMERVKRIEKDVEELKLKLKLV